MSCSSTSTTYQVERISGDHWAISSRVCSEAIEELVVVTGFISVFLAYNGIDGVGERRFRL